MNSVIAVGFTLEWSYSVSVWDDGAGERRIHGPRAALRYLQDDFSIRSGQAYWTAIDACNAALLHRCDVDEARTHFIAAYAEYMVKLHGQQ
ncbi:DUF982 domain-containing protein [Neorhizobium lilium]|uniref:DUF982 domain-containing protein n=1 Tax=Neorhizobium lilium TaxID=2503024 RepID=UPI0013E291CB|nr:DUF982 domain-containing protein [Neorhizobium lilium]